MSDRIARDFFAYLPARVIPPVFALFAIPVFTRMLPGREYGAYLLAVATLTLIGSLCAAWLGSMVVRFGSTIGGKALRALCLPFLIASMIAGALCWLGGAALQDDPVRSLRYVLPGVIWIVTYAPFEYLTAWLRTENRAGAYTLTLCWRAFASLLLPIPILILDLGGGEVILWAGAVAMLLGCAVLWRAAAGADLTASQGISSAKQRRELLRYGMPAAATNFALVGLSVIDRFIVNRFFGAHAVAVYGASYDIAEKSVFFLNAMLLLSSTVMIVQVFEKEGQEQASAFLSSLMRAYFVLATPIIVIIAVLSPQIVSLLLPADYGQGATILPLVMTSAAFVGIMHRYSLVLSLHKRTDLLMWSTFAALGVKIIASLVLVPLHGILGAAFSTVLGYGSWLAFVRIAAARFPVPYFPWKSFLRTLVSGGLAGLAAWLIVGDGLVSLLIATMAGLCIYLLGLLIVRETNLRELSSLKNIVTGQSQATGPEPPR